MHRSSKPLMAAESLGYGGWLSAVALLFRRCQIFPSQTIPTLFWDCSQATSNMQWNPLAIGQLLKKNTRTRPRLAAWSSGRLCWSACNGQWSERLAAQFGQPSEEPKTTENTNYCSRGVEPRSLPSLEKKSWPTNIAIVVDQCRKITLFNQLPMTDIVERVTRITFIQQLVDLNRKFSIIIGGLMT